MRDTMPQLDIYATNKSPSIMNGLHLDKFLSKGVL